ncbi:MAG: hypothetical protein V3W44_10800 [Dehalococcoidales bacterium]
MAITYVSDWRIIVEPTLAVDVFMTMDSVAVNAVLLTRENLRKVGAYPPQSGHDWDVNMWLKTVIAGVETGAPLTAPTAIAGTYWDPMVQTATVLTLAIDADQVVNAGLFTITFADTDTLVAGMYRFEIDVTDTVADIHVLCSGWLEILPARPVP